MAKTEQDTDAVDLSRVRKLWWHNRDLQAAARKILDNPDGRTELHLADRLLYVIAQEATTEDGDDGPWNFSHPCPPVCP